MRAMPSKPKLTTMKLTEAKKSVSKYSKFYIHDTQKKVTYFIDGDQSLSGIVGTYFPPPMTAPSTVREVEGVIFKDGQNFDHNNNRTFRQWKGLKVIAVTEAGKVYRTKLECLEYSNFQKA